MANDASERLKKIVRFAMDNERLSAELYKGLAQSNSKPALARMCMKFAREEEEHLFKLESLIEGPHLTPPDADILGRITVADCPVPDEDPRSMDSEGLLRFALAKESAAQRLYSDLAEASRETWVKELFLLLAEQEGVHRMRFEAELERIGCMRQ
ncbi:MAG: ferritin family protein [Elusimicrobiota bacterium]|jgi:rubrerythrin